MRLNLTSHLFFNALLSHVYPHLFIDALGVAHRKEQSIARDCRTRHNCHLVGQSGQGCYLVRLCSRIHAQSLLALSTLLMSSLRVTSHSATCLTMLCYRTSEHFWSLETEALSSHLLLHLASY
jgi:hypothetical protein